MSPTKSILRAILIVAVMMGALTLGAPPADANSSGPICEQGALNADGQCEVEVDPVGDACPAVEADGECFELVPVDEICPTGNAVGGDCRISVPDTITPTCEPPTEPAGDGACVAFEPATEEVGCLEGELIDDSCWEFTGDAEQETFCPNDEDAQGCFRTEDPLYECEIGFLVDLDLCAFNVDPVEGEPECPVPTWTDIVEFDDGDHCGVTDIGEVECGFGEYFGDGVCAEFFFPELDSCEIYFELSEIYDFIGEEFGACYGWNFDDDQPECDNQLVPIFGGEVIACLLGPSSACPDGFEYDGEVCILYYDATILCPPEYPLDLGFADDEPLCFQDYGPLVTPLECPDGEPFIEGCIEFVPAFPVCPNGDLTEVLDCRIAEDPVLGGPFCPGGGTLLFGELCYEDLGAPEVIYSCPVGNLTGGSFCVVPADPVDVASCDGVLGEAGDCYILEPAQVQCPEGAAPGPEFPADCRLPVDRVGDGCPGDTIDLGDRCVTLSDPVWYCNGLLVTINMILGDSGNGTSGIDVILGTTGDDVIRGYSGADTICGGDGNDRIYGAGGADTIFGEDGADWISGSSGDDYIDGGDGNDIMYGGNNNDILWGSYGDDQLRGGSGNDQLRGGYGTDILLGYQGNDLLRGGIGDDTLNGGSGTDDCRNFPGNDTLLNCEPIAVA